jgi:hypothetical protein
MSFVYCRECGWGQDDFQTEHYTPAKPDEMEWLTKEQFLRENPTWKCPSCEQTTLRED